MRHGKVRVRRVKKCCEGKGECGDVWCDVVMCGVVWCGDVWSGVVMCGVVW